MKHSVIRFDTSYLCGLIDKSCGRREFAKAMKVSEGRLSRLLDGAAEFTQSEMVSAAELLGLDASGFTRCFFVEKFRNSKLLI